MAWSSCLNTFRYCSCCADNCCPMIKAYPEQFPRNWRSQAGTDDLLTYWLIDLLAYQPHSLLLSFQRFCHDYLQLYLRPGNQHARSSHGAPTLWVQMADPDPAMDEQIHTDTNIQWKSRLGGQVTHRYLEWPGKELIAVALICQWNSHLFSSD